MVMDKNNLLLLQKYSVVDVVRNSGKKTIILFIIMIVLVSSLMLIVGGFSFFLYVNLKHIELLIQTILSFLFIVFLISIFVFRWSVKFYDDGLVLIFREILWSDVKEYRIKDKFLYVYYNSNSGMKFLILNNKQRIVSILNSKGIQESLKK